MPRTAFLDPRQRGDGVVTNEVVVIDGNGVAIVAGYVRENADGSSTALGPNRQRLGEYPTRFAAEDAAIRQLGADSQ